MALWKFNLYFRLMEVIVPIYGFRGTLLILGACMLHVCLSATLYRPIEVHQVIVELDLKKANKNGSYNIAIQESGTLTTINNPADRELVPTSATDHIVDDVASITSSPPASPRQSRRRSEMVHSIEDLSTVSTVYYEKNSVPTSNEYPLKQPPMLADSCEKSSFTSTLRRYIDLSLLTNPLFIIICWTVMLMATGCPQALFFLPSYANSQGMTKSDCSLLLSISAIVDFVGRLGMGYVADLGIISITTAYSLRYTDCNTNLLNHSSLLFHIDIVLYLQYAHGGSVCSCHFLSFEFRFFRRHRCLLRTRSGLLVRSDSYKTVREPRHRDNRVLIRIGPPISGCRQPGCAACYW